MKLSDKARIFVKIILWILAIVPTLLVLFIIPRDRFTEITGWPIAYSFADVLSFSIKGKLWFLWWVGGIGFMIFHFAWGMGTRAGEDLAGVDNKDTKDKTE